MSARIDLLEAFEADTLDPAVFDHLAHVEVAAAMLAQTDFLDAVARYQRGIARIAVRAGAANKANLTITIAFLSLIAERLAQDPRLDAHPELMDRKLLAQWYSGARLAQPHARAAFLMPDRGP